MLPFVLGIVRVVTTSDEGLLGAHGRLVESAFPGVKTISECIPDQPAGVHDAATDASAAAKVPSVAQSLAARGVEAIVVSCANDPGVAGAESLAGVPVVGAGSAAAAVALSYGLPVGVLGLIPELPGAVTRVLRGSLVAGASPSGVRTTLDLLTLEGRRAALAAAGSLVSSGAGVICLACTGMSTIGLAPQLMRELGVPVVDPVLAAAGVALVRAAQLRGVRGDGG